MVNAISYTTTYTHTQTPTLQQIVCAAEFLKFNFQLNEKVRERVTVKQRMAWDLLRLLAEQDS